ncbi:MAG: beta-ketoacyl synthase N-terminal-like domain-containing protein [Phycisphaerales bacterium]
MPRQSRAVVITGTGTVTPFGLGTGALWQALCEGKSGFGPCRTFDFSGFPTPYVAQIADEAFDLKSVVPKSYRKATKVMSRDIELSVGAASAAVADAGLVTKAHEQGSVTIPPARFGCHIGAGLIAAEENELTGALATARAADGAFDVAKWGREGMSNLTPLWMLKYLPNMLACHVTIIHDCQGPSNTITCAEASSLLSIGESMRVIGRGDADACLSGGGESKTNLMGMMRQLYARRLATTQPGEDAATVVRPFAPDAKGGLPGEGAGLLVLEAADLAQKRGAKALAVLAGFGASQSFCPDTLGVDPAADGQGMVDAMEAALADAGMKAAEIDAVVPFGSGVPALDAAERAALQAVFGARAATLPLVTVMTAVGNCGAGHGALAAAVAVRCLAEQKLPARINTKGAQGLDANAAPARSAQLGAVMVVTPSLGGQNAAIILRRAS